MCFQKKKKKNEIEINNLKSIPVDLSSWQSKINEEKTLDYEIEEDVEIEETVNVSFYSN